MRLLQQSNSLLAGSSLVLLVALGGTHAKAQTNWTGNTSNDWFVVTNWSAGIPSSGTPTNIDVPAGNPAPVISGGAASSGLLAVGQNAAGSLTIQNGGRLDTGPTLGSDIANGAGSTGTVTVTGAGSVWSNAGFLSVGTRGTATLIISNGGTVTSSDAGGFIGYTDNAQGTVLVTGPGSAWNIFPTDPNGGLRVGGSLQAGVIPPGIGTGTLTVADGGIVSVIGGTGTIFVAERPGSIGTVNIGAAPGNAPVAAGFLNATSVLFGNGAPTAATLNFNHTAADYVFSPVIGGNGNVNVFSGTTIVTANNPYTGNTTISGGTFAVGDPTHPSAALSGGGNVTIAPGATLGGYGSVTGTVFNSGTVAAASALPVFAGGPFGSLTINGNYVGNGGLLNVRTVLAGDGSPSDKLVISNGTGTGSTRIHVTSAGGAGALTTGDGILVVQAINGATTTPNAFNLGGPVSAGPYDYFLFRGGVSPGSQNSWFLRSSLVPGPTPSPVTPLYRPEVAVQSAVPSTALALARIAVGTFNERQGDQLLLQGDRAPGWGRVFGQQTREHFAQGAQPEFYGTYAGFQAGRDFLQMTPAAGHTDHVGLYIAYSRAVGNVNGFVDGIEGTSAGHLDLAANSVGGYWTHIGPSNWYIDAVLQGSFIDGIPTSDRQLKTNTYARAITASLEGGYPIPLAPWLALEPQAQMIWQRLWINDAFDGISPIAFSHPEALTGRVGTLLRGTFGGPAAVWQPYLKGNVWFGGNGTDLVTFATTPVPVQRNQGTALEGGGGITGKLTQSIGVYADASYLSSISGEQWIALKGNVGLRVTW